MIDTTSSFFDRIRMQGNPAANAGSVLVCGRARFTMLTERLVRLEWSPESYFEDRGTFAFPNRNAQIPTFSHDSQGAHWDINTNSLRIHFTDDGQPFNKTNLSIEFNVDGKQTQWVPGMVNTGNLRGTRRTLDQCADAASLQEGLLSRDGWSLFDDSGSAVLSRDQRWGEARPEAHRQDLDFFGYGHDYKTLLKDYVKFGGQIPLVPKYGLGAWCSPYSAYPADDPSDI